MVTGFDPVNFNMIGCCKIELDSSVLEQIRSAVENEQWEQPTPEGVSFASWISSGSLNPPAYMTLLDHIDQVTGQLFGSGYKRHMVSMWSGGEQLNWHNHVDDNELKDFHWIVYLGSDDWCEQAGGLLQAKNSMMDDVLTVEPTYGTAVLLNNSHPAYLHKVTPFVPVRTRIVFQVGYEYVNGLVA